MSHYDPSEEGDENPSQESYHQIPPTTVMRTGRSLRVRSSDMRDSPGARQFSPSQNSLHPPHHALITTKGDAIELRGWEGWSQDDEAGQAGEEPVSLDNMSTSFLNGVDTPPTENTRGHTPEQDNRSGKRVLREKPSSIHIRVPTNKNISNMSIDVDPTVMSDIHIEIGRDNPK